MGPLPAQKVHAAEGASLFRPTLAVARLTEKIGKVRNANRGRGQAMIYRIEKRWLVLYYSDFKIRTIGQNTQMPVHAFPSHYADFYLPRPTTRSRQAVSWRLLSRILPHIMCHSVLSL
jgi:hypothetical protein